MGLRECVAAITNVKGFVFKAGYTDLLIGPHVCCLIILSILTRSNLRKCAFFLHVYMAFPLEVDPGADWMLIKSHHMT